MLLTALAQFIGGFVVIVISAELLLTISKALARKWKMSPLIMALVLVALGTTIPELTVLISAISRNDAALALGNLVGSNIANVTLIFGTAILVGRPRIESSKTPKNALLMLVITLLFLVLRLDGIPYVTQGLILIAVSTAVILYQYLMARRGQRYEDRLLKRAKKSVTPTVKFYQSLPLYMVFVAVLGAVIGLVVGGQLLVISSQAIAHIFGISTTVIGLTLVAVTTSFPELITIVLAGIKDDDKIIAGTIIGSNIYNLGFYAGISSLFQQTSYLSRTDMGFLVFTSMMFVGLLLFYAGSKVPRWVGIVSYLLFAAFVFQAFLFEGSPLF